MLNSTYTLPIKKREGDFPLSLPIDSNWSSHKNRMLIVCETVDSKDLKDGRFLSERSKTVLVNTLNFAKRNARKIKGEGLDPFGFAAINFNNAKTYHFKTEIEKAPYQARFVRRIYKAIETLKPTHVLVCGDLAMHKLFPDIDNSQWKRGWVHTVNLRDLKLKVTSTLDLEPLYVPKKGVDTSDDDDDNDEVNSDIFGKANLLGYVARNITNLLLGRHAFSLKHIVPKPIYIDTIERFDWFYKKLEEASIVAVDTETKDLSATKNLIYTIQFAFSKDKGYVIPMYHPQTPFSQEELKYIRSKLKKWFAAEPESDFKFMLMMNGKFDIKVARNQFCLPIILRPVWEVTAGEHVLDENLKWLKKMGNTPAGNLRAIFTSYDNDLYWTLPFSKDERATIAFVKPSNKDFQNYAVLDVQCLHGIYEMQIAQSKLLEIEGKCYTPYFKLLVSEQMNNTVHTLSHMESRGVGMDGYYLAHLKSKESPLVKTLDEVKVELSQMPAVKKANKLLLERDTSTASGGLFTKTNWVFNLNKPEHKTTLFFDVMGLEPLTYTKTKQPQVDKNFQKAYKDDYKEVRAFATYQEVSKLWGCLSGDTLIPTDKGLLTLESMGRCLPGDTEKLSLTVGSAKEPQKSLLWWNNGLSKTLLIKIEDGRSIQGTFNHKIRILEVDGGKVWKRLDELCVGDTVCINLTRIVRTSKLKLNIEIPIITYKSGVINSRKNLLLFLKNIKTFTTSDIAKVTKYSIKHINLSIVKKLIKNKSICVYGTKGKATLFKVRKLRNNSCDLPTLEKHVVTKVPKYMTPKLAYALGLFVAEGFLGKRTVTLRMKNKEPVKTVFYILKNIFGISAYFEAEKSVSSGRRLWKNTVYEDYMYTLRIQGNTLPDIFKKLGVIGRSSEKRIPWCILQADSKSQIAFLAGLWEGDGSQNDGKLIFCSISNLLNKELQLLLNSHGYRASIYSNNKRVIVPRTESKLLWGSMRKYITSPKTYRHISRSNLDVPKFTYKQITSITYGGIKNVYDLSMSTGFDGKLPVYVANGIITHNTYVKGWYTKIKSSPDGSYDGRLRPSYGFFDVVTGRLNSFDPSLQQVPSRGSLAKYIKRAFVAPTGTLHVKFDFSAHEVRFWGIIAKDDVIADTFRQGQKLRQKFRKTPSPEISQEIKKKGDVHIINIYHFFKKWVEKSDPLRDAIKAIVFGTIYSMSANSLSKSLKKQRVAELEDKIRKLTKREAELKASL